MTKRILIGLVAVGFGLWGVEAQALTITATTQQQFTTTETDDIGSLAELNLDFGTNFSGISNLYFADNNGDSGGLGSSYQTSFTAGDEGATIDYISGPSFNCSNPATPCLLLVKDGNNQPAQYLFNLSNITNIPGTTFWNGTDDLVLSGLWPDQGSISHIELWGVSTSTTTTPTTTTTPSTVPEPGMLVLLGAGLGVVAHRLRRRQSA